MKCKIILTCNNIITKTDYSHFYQSPTSYIEALQKSTLDFNNLKMLESNQEEIVTSTSCEGKIYNELLDTDLIYTLHNQTLYKVNLSLDVDTMEEDFEDRIKEWLRKSYLISTSNLPSKMKSNQMPLEDFLIEIQQGNQKFTFLLEQCKFINYVNNNTFTILVGKVVEK